MNEKINVISGYNTLWDYKTFSFTGNFYIDDVWDNLQCSCGQPLVSAYTYVIWKLKRAGLLKKDHKLMCCGCYDSLCQK